MGSGGGSTTIEIKNSGTSTLDVAGLDNVKVDETLELKLPQPFQTSAVAELKLPQPFQTRSEFALTQPVVTDNKSALELDVKPLVVDLCLNVNIGKIPPTHIRQPYDHRIGFRLFGIEIFGFSFAGESQVIIGDPTPEPKVVWGGEEKPAHGPRRARHSSPESGGLRIRLHD